MEVYGCRAAVPTLVVENQRDDLIAGNNLLRNLIHQLKSCQNLSDNVSASEPSEVEKHHLFSLIAHVETWAESDVPDKVGTVRIKRAVTLEPQSEHLVWGRLQSVGSISVGSTVIVEPTTARSRPISVLVGKTVALLRSDGWLPLKVINPLEKHVTLKRNAKKADVYPCMALEDFHCFDVTHASQHCVQQQTQEAADVSTARQVVSSLTSDVSNITDGCPRNGVPVEVWAVPALYNVTWGWET